MVGPLLAAAGVTGGATLRQLSGIVTSIPAHTDMDIRFVAAGQPCSAPFGGGGFNASGGSTEVLLAPAQTQLGSASEWTVGLVDTSFTAAASQATVIASNQVHEANGETIDVFDTTAADGGAEATLAAGVTPGNQGSAITLTSGTYALRVANSATKSTLATPSGVALANGQREALVWFHDAAAHGSLAQCNLIDVGAGQMGACAP
jgi:hypothetical protein